MVCIKHYIIGHLASLRRSLQILFLAGVLVGTVGCDSVRNDKDDLPAITSDGDAEFVVEHLVESILYDKVVRQLTAGTHSQTVIAGSSGRATVSGHANYRSGLSCGSDCVRSESDVQLTIALDDFESTAPGNIETSVRGTVTYSDNGWSRQSGLSYSSGGRVTVEGADVRFRIVGRDGAGQWGYQGTMTFRASGNSATGNLSGMCQVGGTTHQF